MILTKSTREIREVIQKLSQHITHGSVENFANYRFMVGQIKGLEQTLEIIKKHIGEENV